jgi:hypothetical protein
MATRAVLSEKAGYPDTRCGSVTFAQRFGSALNLNPHFHTEGHRKQILIAARRNEPNLSEPLDTLHSKANEFRSLGDGCRKTGLSGWELAIRKA